jgi:hypothetical protein
MDSALAVRGAITLIRARSLRLLLAAAIIAAYPLASFAPFQPLHWSFPKQVRNGAELLAQGGIAFPTPGVVRSVRPPDWVAAAMRSQQLELELRVHAFESDQHGPARIFTLSADPYYRNLTIGQEGENLILRLRTAGTDLNGIRADGAPFAELQGIFQRSDAWVEIRLGIEPGRLRLSATAPQTGQRTEFETALAPEPLRDWDPSYLVGLGNELTSDRVWLGEIGQALVRTGGTSFDYAAADAHGALEVSPERFWFSRQNFTLVPFSDFELEDGLVNVVGYVPLGLLFGVVGWLRGGARRGWPRLVALVLAVAAVSATFEFLQFAFPHRHPSTTDLVLNTLGGAIGILMVVSAQAAGLKVDRGR